VASFAYCAKLLGLSEPERKHMKSLVDIDTSRPEKGNVNTHRFANAAQTMIDMVDAETASILKQVQDNTSSTIKQEPSVIPKGAMTKQQLIDSGVMKGEKGVETFSFDAASGERRDWKAYQVTKGMPEELT
jgi:hypothetical protein